MQKPHVVYDSVDHTCYWTPLTKKKIATAADMARAWSMDVTPPKQFHPDWPDDYQDGDNIFSVTVFDPAESMTALADDESINSPFGEHGRSKFFAQLTSIIGETQSGSSKGFLNGFGDMAENRMELPSYTAPYTTWWVSADGMPNRLEKVSRKDVEWPGKMGMPEKTPLIQKILDREVGELTDVFKYPMYRVFFQFSEDDERLPTRFLLVSLA